MNTIRNVVGGCLTMAAATMLTSAHAAYPAKMHVVIEVENQAAQDLHMIHASWDRQGAQLSSRLIPAQQSGTTINLTFGNPRSGSATFRYASAEGKSCEFKLAHEVRFSWFSLNPAPEKSASARSIGAVAAECLGAVTRGAEAMGSYTVRFSMK